MLTTFPDLFSTVADKDYLHLFDGEKPRCEDVMDFIGLKKRDVAGATGVSQASLRWDDRIPPGVEDRFKEWANLLNLVAQYFSGDAHKTALWFTLPNPLLGNIKPRDMIRIGQYKKLYKFIINALSENKA